MKLLRRNDKSRWSQRDEKIQMKSKRWENRSLVWESLAKILSMPVVIAPGSRRKGAVVWVHKPLKEDCPAYGQTCRCSKRKIFDMVYKTNPGESSGWVSQLCEETLTCTESIHSPVNSQLIVEGHKVGFLLDCGSMVNILPSLVPHVIYLKCTRICAPSSTLWLCDCKELHIVYDKSLSPAFEDIMPN